MLRGLSLSCTIYTAQRHQPSELLQGYCWGGMFILSIVAYGMLGIGIIVLIVGAQNPTPTTYQCGNGCQAAICYTFGVADPCTCGTTCEYYRGINYGGTPSSYSIPGAVMLILGVLLAICQGGFTGCCSSPRAIRRRRAGTVHVQLSAI
jgi:hypothetical protein